MNIIDNFRRIDYELKKYISTSSTYYLKSRRRMDIFYITGIVGKLRLNISTLTTKPIEHYFQFQFVVSSSHY